MARGSAFTHCVKVWIDCDSVSLKTTPVPSLSASAVCPGRCLLPSSFGLEKNPFKEEKFVNIEMILCIVLCVLFLTPHLQRSLVRQAGEVDRVYGEGEGGGAGGQPAGRVVTQVQRARHHQQVHVETRLGDNSYIDCYDNRL